MKLSEVKPCPGCSGPLLSPGLACFYRIKVDQGLVSPRAFNQTMGLTQSLQGHLRLAEVFSPDPDPIKFIGDSAKDAITMLYVCFNCYASKPLAELVESAERKEVPAE